MHDDDSGPTASFFELLLEEAVGPLFVTLAGVEHIIDVPASIDVADLDQVTSLSDQLDCLIPDEDQVDAILAAFDDQPHSALAEFVADTRAHFGILTPPRYGWAALVSEIDRYGEAIERDLLNLQLDLYDWVRKHEHLPWAKLFRILQRPADGSYYTAARASDLELAEQIARLEAEGLIEPPTSTPGLEGYTAERESLTRIADALDRIEHGIWAASPKFKGKGGRAPKPTPRPRTARDRLATIQTYRDHDEIASQVLGTRYKRIFSDHQEV